MPEKRGWVRIYNSDTGRGVVYNDASDEGVEEYRISEEALAEGYSGVQSGDEVVFYVDDADESGVSDMRPAEGGESTG